MKERIRDAERSRRSLIDAATTLFARNGYDGTSLQSIADRAKVNKAMISYHFGGKRGLYAAVVKDLVSGVRERLHALRTSKASAPDRLAQFIHTFVEFATERPAFGTIVLREHLAGGERFDDEILPDFLEFFRTTQSIVRQGVRDGAFRRVDPHAVHLSLIGSLIFFLSSQPMRERLVDQRKIDAGAPELDEFVKHTQRLFSGGLAKPRPTRKRRARPKGE